MMKDNVRLTNQRTSKHSQAGFGSLALLALSAALLFASPSRVQAGRWIHQGSGDWGTSSNWENGDIAGAVGDTVDFSSINVTGNYTVTLDGSRVVGNLLFGDTSGSTTHEWIFDGTDGSVLSLAVYSGVPTITLQPEGPGVNVVFNVPLAGTQGFTKKGARTLTLTVPSAYSGTTTVAEGLLDVTSDGALGSGDVALSDGATLRLDSGIANDYIGDNGSLLLSGSAIVNLDFTGAADTVAGLSFDGGMTFAAPGTWGATGSGATHVDDVHFQGAGMLNVLLPKAAITLVSSANPSATGQSVTFTATLTGAGGTPTGSVTFKDGGATLGVSSVDDSGSASLSTSDLPATGSPQTISAVYSGDANYLAGTTATVSQIVNPADGILFSDDFTRPSDPSPIDPWTAYGTSAWTLTGGVLSSQSGPSQYAFAYIATNWTDYSVSARVSFPAGSPAGGGGIGGRLDAATGAHYVAWIFPDSSPWGPPNTLRLGKFINWTSLTPVSMQDVSLPGSVGNDWHTVKLTFKGNEIMVSYDGTQMIDVTDNNFGGVPANLSGSISADTHQDATIFSMLVDDVVVTAPVSQLTQSITFGPLADMTYGDAPFAPAATASSVLPVSFSIVSGPATFSDGMVTLTGAGQVTVRASQPGNVNYLTAADVDQSFQASPATLTPSVTVSDKPYDGTMAATILTRDLSGVLNGDDVSLAGGVASFADKLVGNLKPVSVTGLTLAGAASGSYQLALDSASATASITTRPLTVTATGVDKVYNSTAAASVVLSDDHLAGDDIATAYATASFADQNVGNGKPVSVTGITVSGGDAGNYAANTTATGSANISQAPMTVTVDSKTRPFHTPDPTFTGTISGVQGTDEIDATYVTTATIDSPAGNYPITPQLADPLGVLPNYAVTTNGGTLTIISSEPVIVLNTNMVVYTLCSRPASLAPLASFIGTGGSSYAGAKLTVSLMANPGPKDLLSVSSAGSASGGIAMAGAAVSFSGAQICTCSGGGPGGCTMQFTFNAAATDAGIQELIQSLTFSIASPAATNLSRTIELDFDAGGGQTSAPVSLNVAINHAPVADPDRLATGTNVPVVISFARMLLNDSDQDADPLTVWQVDAISLNGGILTTNETGVTYTPPDGFSGLDQFSYVANDGRGGTNAASVFVSVLKEGGFAIEDLDFDPVSGQISAPLAVMGFPGRTYHILASDDLFSWTELGTVTAPDTRLVKFYDTDALSHKYRFYRTKYP